MAKNAKNSGMWAYLDASGVLENGNEEEIKAAKKAYRKLYLLNYKRKQRASVPEFIVCLSKNDGEYSRILSASKAHGKTIPAFLRIATLAYISKTYIIPDRLIVARLEQLLSQCLNEIQQIGRYGDLEYSIESQRSQMGIFMQLLHQRMHHLGQDLTT